MIFMLLLGFCGDFYGSERHLLVASWGRGRMDMSPQSYFDSFHHAFYGIGIDIDLLSPACDKEIIGAPYAAPSSFQPYSRHKKNRDRHINKPTGSLCEELFRSNQKRVNQGFYKPLKICA